MFQKNGYLSSTLKMRRSKQTSPRNNLVGQNSNSGQVTRPDKGFICILAPTFYDQEVDTSVRSILDYCRFRVEYVCTCICTSPKSIETQDGVLVHVQEST